MIKVAVIALLMGGLAVATAALHSENEREDLGGGLAKFAKMVRQYVDSQPQDFRLSDGVHLVNVHNENDARSLNEDKSVLGTMENYLKTHELRIRLPELMPGEGFGRAFKDAMDGIQKGDSPGTGRGKGDKGGGMGGVALLGLLFGKTLAALGIGGVGLLAMKALMVSALALMLSLIIGLKKLVSSHDDHGGHTVIHASGGHGHEYRKKREAAELAYRAWSPYATSS